MSNPFLKFHDLGYSRLVPILPPDAPVSPRSMMAKRIAAGDDARGKAPGVKWPDGTWSGYDFVAHESSYPDLERWGAMGAGVGLKTGRGLALIDADTLDERSATIIRETVERLLGVLPVRIGKAPKAGYLVRVEGEFRYCRVEFGARDDKGRLHERVEILYEGRQFVCDGTHPGTRKPYHWPAGIPRREDIPVVPASALHGLLDALRAVLPGAGDLVREGAQTTVDQNALRAPTDVVRRAVEAMPNRSAAFPSRESYLKVGYAIKAATADDPLHGLAIYEDWCARWEEGDNAPDQVAADWARMQPPFRVGAPLLFDLAEETSNGAFRAADGIAGKWFDDTPLTPLFGGSEAMASPSNPNLPKRFEILSIADLFDRPDPRFLIDRHIPESSVGFLYGDPGSLKTFTALDAALSLAFDRPDWQGDPIRQRAGGRVLYIAGEGSSGMKLRIEAWCERRGIGLGAARDGRFGLVHQPMNFISQDDIPALVASCESWASADPGDAERGGTGARDPVNLIVVDTVSRALPGADENLQQDMTLFIRACDVLRDRFGCAVLGVHHAGKSGDMRGSTVLRGAGDFVLKMERSAGSMFGRLVCEKQKDAPDGWSDVYRFDVVTLGADRSSLVAERVADTIAPGVAMSADAAGEVLAAMAAAWAARRPWSMASQSGERRAVRRMVADHGFSAAAAESVLGMWLATGVLQEAQVSTKSKMRGLEVVDGGTRLAPVADEQNVFA